MWKELIDSFQFNLKSKTSNPFFGTLIIVWFLDHWEMLYGIFNFPNYTLLQVKIDYLAKYLNPGPFTVNFLKCIAISIIVLIISYLLLSLSRYIINIYENRLLPVVYKYSAPDKIVLREQYEREKNEKNRLEVRLEEEKDSRVRLQMEIDGAEQKIVSLEKILSEKDNKISEIEKSKNKVAPNNENLPLPYPKNEFSLLYNKIKAKKYDLQFQNLIETIRLSETVSLEMYQSKYFIGLGLISGEHVFNGYLLKFTSKGEKFVEYFLSKKLSEGQSTKKTKFTTLN